MNLCKRMYLHLKMLKLHIFAEATELFISVTFKNIIFSYFSWSCQLGRSSFQVINLVDSILALHSTFYPVMPKHLKRY